jgi:RNA polymerase sigma-70 factor (ECF subfamily)
MSAYAGVADEQVLAAYTDDRAGRAAREAAFHELVDRYERRIYGIAYRYFGNHADAQDATQDTFLQLARKADQFRGDSSLSTWIYRIATNACNDLGRKMARRPQTPVEDVEELRVAGDETETDDLIAGRELVLEVQRALLQLDDLSRQLIILCAIEGRSYAEASAALDLPVGTIKSRVFRARARLAELLRPVIEVEDELPTVVRSRVADHQPDPARRPRGPPTGPA